jgi:hypothetical protein
MCSEISALRRWSSEKTNLKIFTHFKILKRIIETIVILTVNNIIVGIRLSYCYYSRLSNSFVYICCHYFCFKLRYEN